jgi:hypothetical protein
MGCFATLREDRDFLVTVLNCAVVTHAEAEGRENRDERIYGLLARGILGPKIKILGIRPPPAAVISGRPGNAVILWGFATGLIESATGSESESWVERI